MMSSKPDKIILDEVKVIEDKIEKELKLLKEQIRYGNQPNKNNLDGYVLAGLRRKVDILNNALKELRNA